MDVIALDQAGIDEVVAPLGTALTEAQLGLLWSSPRRRSSASTAMPPGRRRRFGRRCGRCPMSGRAARSASSTLPAGQDPDDLIRAGGRGALDALLERPESLVDRLWRHELDAEPLTTRSRKRDCGGGSPTMSRRSRTRTCASNIASSC